MGRAGGNVDSSLGTSHDNFVILYLKSIFGRAKSVAKFQDRRFAWEHKLIVNCGGHSEITSFHLRAEAKMEAVFAFANWIFQIIIPFMWWDLNWKSQSTCSWQKKNEGQTYDLRLRLSIKKACGAFENQLQEGNFDRENWFYQTDSPLESQINLTYRLSKSFSKPILLSEIAQREWQRTLRGRSNCLNHWGKEAGR